MTTEKDIKDEEKVEEVKTVVPATEKIEAATPVMTTVESPDVSQPADFSHPEVIDTIDTVDMGYTKTSSNKMLYVLVGVLALILISLVALFFYRQYTNTPEIGEVTPTPAAEVTVEKPSPSVTPTNDEDAELQDIVIEDVDADLKDIEADMKEL